MTPSEHITMLHSSTCTACAALPTAFFFALVSITDAVNDLLVYKNNILRPISPVIKHNNKQYQEF